MGGQAGPGHSQQGACASADPSTPRGEHRVWGGLGAGASRYVSPVLPRTCLCHFALYALAHILSASPHFPHSLQAVGSHTNTAPSTVSPSWLSARPPSAWHSGRLGRQVLDSQVPREPIPRSPLSPPSPSTGYIPVSVSHSHSRCPRSTVVVWHVYAQEDDRKAALAACVDASVIVIPLAGNETFTADILSALGEALDEAQLKEKVVIGVTVATTWAKTIPFKTADGELIPMTERVWTVLMSNMDPNDVPRLRARERCWERWPFEQSTFLEFLTAVWLTCSSVFHHVVRVHG